MEPALKKSLDDLATIVTAVQEKNTDIEKKYDGLRLTEIKDLSDKASEMADDLQKMSKSKEEQQKRIDDLEKLLSRSGNGGGDIKTAIEEYDEAFVKYVRTGEKMDREVAKKGLMELIRTSGISEEDLEMKTMQVGINPQGGYWVKPERIAKTVKQEFETSPIRSIADVMTTSSNGIELLVDDDEADAEDQKTEMSVQAQTDTPDIGLLTILTHGVSAEPKITQELLDDAAFDTASWLQRKINNKIGRIENTNYVLGNGANRAKGFLDYAAWVVAQTYERNKIEQVNSGAAGLPTADGLIKLQNFLKEIYQRNAKFVMRRLTWGEIIKLKDGNLNYLINPQMLRNGAGQLILLGQPVVFADDMPAHAADSLSIAYGDFREGYTIVDKVGVVVIRDNITDKGRVKFYTKKRTGGAVTNFEAIKIQKFAV